MRPTCYIKYLSCFTDLEELNLSSTGVSGDVSGVAPLVKLTVLHLSNTSVGGDVSGVAPLVNLTDLQLNITSVGGDAVSYTHLTLPTKA